ncbi:MAG: NAD+ synthase [Candidatus Omnitrophica bacterium]|nr:NAD+ synthase [Candidatus Omnitrophota bacterium]
MKKNNLRVTLAQINTTVGDFEGNREKVLKAIEIAKAGRADLAVFPELTLTGYPPEDLLFKEKFVTENLQTLGSIAPHTRGLGVILGFVDRDKKGRLYNAAAVFSDGKHRLSYHKLELPNYGVFDEKRYFSAGVSNGLFQLNGKRCGLTICEDIWQKDSLVYRNRAVRRTDLLVNISASPYHRGKQKEREALLQGLARKTRSNVVYLNLIGGQDELVFDGGSLVVTRDGKVIARAKRFEEDVVTVDIPIGNGDGPSPQKRRGLLSDDAEIYSALRLGTRDYVRKNEFKKVLVGLSGGIDSALVARIAVDALGSHNVIGVTMPSRYTSRGTYRDAKQLASNLGIPCLEFKIDGIFRKYLEALKRVFRALRMDSTEENLQARIRGTLLMALSNKFGYLVLTTGNKSELATGYCTLYGDMAGGFAVIKDVPKTRVFRLAKYRNGLEPKRSIPESVLRRPPTAELKPHQKDQDTLPPYPLLDRFLELYVEQDLSVEAISRRGIPRALVNRLARSVDLNEYKRRQSPPGVKITPKAFGRDRRMPITRACPQKI